MVFRVAQISDTHLSGSKPFFVENFRRVVDAIAADRPDLVINTGDISLDGADHEGDLAAARELHAALGLPVRFIPGNHDVGDNAGVAGAHHVIDAERRARYVRYFGDDWWCLDVPGWRLIGIDTQLFASGLPAEHDQQAFLVHAATGAPDQRLALFVHKPLFDAHAGEQVIGGRFLNPVPRARLLEPFAGRAPRLVACGHVHQYRTTAVEATSCVWCPSTAFYLPDSRQPRYGAKQVGYVAHTFHQDGTHECQLVCPPGAENLCLADFPGAYGPMS
jgi:3',5'-cyclic-AMP phosphodiesterase